MRKIVSVLCIACVMAVVAVAGGRGTVGAEYVHTTDMFRGESLAGLDFKLDSVVKKFYRRSVFNPSRSRYGLIFFDELDTCQINKNDTLYALLMCSSDGSNYDFRTRTYEFTHTHFGRGNRAIKRDGRQRDTIFLADVDASPAWKYLSDWDTASLHHIWGEAKPQPRKIEYMRPLRYYAFRIIVSKGKLGGILVMEQYNCQASEEQLQWLWE